MARIPLLGSRGIIEDHHAGAFIPYSFNQVKVIEDASEISHLPAEDIEPIRPSSSKPSRAKAL